MGIRNRTPIGTLRDQRRNAESVPQVEASKAKTPVRARAPKATLDEKLEIPQETSDSLLERLRIVLRSEGGKSPDSLTEFQVLQDEITRISQHHQQSRTDNTKDLIDLDAPRKHIETAAPFRYIVINGGKSSPSFPLIPKLDRAPSSFDIYTQEIPKEYTPRSMPLTLLICPEENEIKVMVSHDSSHEAAQLTQIRVSSQSATKKGSILPKSLVITLLDDK